MDLFQIHSKNMSFKNFYSNYMKIQFEMSLRGFFINLVYYEVQNSIRPK